MITVNREDVPDDEFVPFVVRPEIRECSICGHNLDGEVAGLWGMLSIKTCSSYRCHQVAAVFLSLHQERVVAEGQAHHRQETIDTLRNEVRRKQALLEAAVARQGDIRWNLRFLRSNLKRKWSDR